MNNSVSMGCSPFRWSHKQISFPALACGELCKNTVGHSNAFWLYTVPHEQITTCMATVSCVSLIQVDTGVPMPRINK